MAHASRSTALKVSRVADTDSAQVGGDEDSASSLTFVAPVSPVAKKNQWSSRHPDPPRSERAVVSRTRFHITLPKPAPPSSSSKTIVNDADQRGWSSPHGEPYRPLGRPELSLKLSPQLISGASPMMQSTHRVRVLEHGEFSGNDANTMNKLGPDKSKDLREPSACAQTPKAGTSITTLVGQFVTSLTSRKRPLDERQVKLAHRLQTSVGGFSPERVRILHRRQPPDGEHECEQNNGQHHFRRKPRGDESMELLRGAINEGTSRLRSTRKGTSFLQRLPPTEPHGLRELHEQYLRERTSAPQPVVGFSSNGIRPSRRVGTRTSQDNNTAQSTNRGDVEDSQSSWYLPYTTRQLQRSPHQRLLSLQEFQARAREDQQPLRPASTIKANTTNRMRASTGRSAHGSLAIARSSMAPNSGALNSVGGQHTDPIFGSAAIVGSKIPFTTAPISSSPVPAMHSVEKLQAAIDALQTTKHQQSVQLATTLAVLQQDRRECLAGKFRSLHVQCDAGEDLRRMREQSERRREQRVIELVSKTADWYPELLRRLLTREISASTGPGTTSVGSSALHAAELFVIRAVGQFTNDGCEFQSMQLFQIILHLHNEDLELMQVQQLLEYLRTALHISYEDWEQFLASHNFPGPITELVDDRKDTQAVGDGKSCFTPANMTRVSALPASFEKQV